ncbi:MAG: hypothetical protein AB1430_19660 [Pseudomonadota bacterium]
MHARLRQLIGNTPLPGERIDVVSLDELGERLYRFALSASRMQRRTVAHRHQQQRVFAVS